MDLKLTGKVALVTGSSRGIGLATAKAFAAEGCRVVLSGRSTEQLRDAETALRVTGADVAAHAGDVGNPDHARRLIEAPSRPMAASTFWSTMSAVAAAARALPTALMTTGAARWNGT
jgi:NAD(P)-dependent dehydrogenase (short-subunit alcohol dehydrogenase family)